MRINWLTDATGTIDIAAGIFSIVCGHLSESGWYPDTYRAFFFFAIAVVATIAILFLIGILVHVTGLME